MDKIIKEIITFLTENELVKWVEQTLKLQSPISYIALYGAMVLVLVLFIIIIACSCSKAKKKKLAKSEKVEATTTVEPKEEPAPVIKEEPKVEEVPVVEEKVEETPLVEEVPVVEEKVEETPVIEEKEEPVVEKPKQEEKSTTKKAATKKTKEEVKEEVKEEPKKVSRATGKYVLVQEGPNWRYKLKASNGEVIIVSEPYTSEKAVRTGIETLKKNIEVSRCDIVEDKHGLFSFRVITKQGRCLATSANYKTKLRAESASESYKRWATSETIILDDAGSTDHNEVEKIEVEIKEEHNGKFVIKQEQTGYIYQLVASNGRVIATSNIYKSKESCLEACEKFRICVYEGSFYVYKDKNSKFQFKLYNKQNRLVLAGEVYSERNRAINVIESIKKLAKYAVVIEQDEVKA